MLQLPVYLDHNATTPCDIAVVEAMMPYFTKMFGNAASRHHSFGWQAEAAVDQAREQVAQLLGAETKEIIFTSGATEAVNLAIKGVFEMYASKGNHIITTNIEHKAVLDTCKHLEKAGADITYLPVDENGLIHPGQIEAAIKKETILIAVMYANNEIGTIMPVKEISVVARRHGVLFFSDASQAVGKIEVKVNPDGPDLLAMTAHKIYGPKGAGALYVRRRDPRVRLVAQMDGGGHERGMRSGTLNVPGIVGLGKACEICMNSMVGDASRISKLRDQLQAGLLELEEVKVNGHTEKRLPNITNLSFRFVEGEALLMGLNKDIALSSGSACTSASIEPSYVLKAIGLDNDLAHSSLRFGLGRSTTEEEVLFIIEKLNQVVGRLRNLSPGWQAFKAGRSLQA
jgi:cysteine desulfurase